MADRKTNHDDGMNNEDLYDEFGNYIGPDLDDDDDDDDDTSDEDDAKEAANRGRSANADDASASSDLSDHGPEGGNRQLIARTLSEEQQQPQQVTEPTAIVLHEDKDHYLPADQVFGENVRTVVLDEDAMDLDKTPILEPTTIKTHTVESAMNIEYNYTDDYLAVQLGNETTRTRRGVAIVGHLHHGKTSLIDLLLEPTIVTLSNSSSSPQQRTGPQQKTPTSTTTTTSTTAPGWGPRSSLNVHQGGGPRYTDTLKTEQERQMSLVSTPITCLLSDTRGKTFCITMIDCPGHVNFHDESVAALRLVDGAVLVIDVVEGIAMHTEMAIRQIVAEGLPMTVVFTKMDRFMVELQLPPRDAYYKLQQILDELNELVGQVSQGRYPELSPAAGNVAFSSAQHGWIYTLHSFAQVYLEHVDTEQGLGPNLSVDEFAKRLWGDCYLDPATRTFQKSPRDCSLQADGKAVQRTFVTYILEPLYKIYTACLGEREPVTNQLLRSVGVLLNKEQLRASARPLLRAALSQFLATAHGGFCEMIVKHVPYPAAAAYAKLRRCYTGPQQLDDATATTDNKVAKAIAACDPAGPLIMHAVKNYYTAGGTAGGGGQASFVTLCRIYSGTVRPATPVQVLGEGYSPTDDDEDAAAATVENVSIPRGRTRTNVSLAKAGNWVLVEGIDAHMAKTATIVSPELLQQHEVHIFAPLTFPQAGNEAVMKLSIEPLNPAELPKMVEGLRRVSKAYPMAKTKVEESGEHVVLGTGELYMDCLMHDLRNVYSDIEVKVADPIVSFRETVVETSSIKCFAETANKRNKLSFIAEPLEEGLAERLESGKVRLLEWDKKKVSRFFQTQYDWDLLSSRSVWAFGDSPTRGTNILLDDTLPTEVDKALLNTCRSSIVQGFQWATREGPLCEEPVRGTKLKILDVVLADKPIFRGGGQIIPTTRRTVHSALLTATPRLMEPIYRLEIQCPGDMVSAIQPVLTRRRGHIVKDRPIPGSTFYNVKGFLPVLDSFGFETDLRTFTQGQAMVLSVFDHWSVVPGDPLDRSIILHPLEPSPPQHLARELLIKTRRRKGLSEDVSVSKFFDEAMKAQLLTPSSTQRGGGGTMPVDMEQ